MAFQTYQPHTDWLLVAIVVLMVALVATMIGISMHDLLESMSRHATTIGGSY